MPVPTVTVQLDQPRVLRFSMGAIQRYADCQDIEPEAISFASGLRFRDIIALVWSCLDEDGRTALPSPDALAEVLGPEEVASMQAALAPLIGRSVPKPAEGGEAATGKARRSSRA